MLNPCAVEVASVSVLRFMDIALWHGRGAGGSTATSRFKRAGRDLFPVGHAILVPSGEPGITQLIDILAARYSLVLTVDDVFLHGSAEVYRLDN